MSARVLLDDTGGWPPFFHSLAASFAEEAGQEIDLDYWAGISSTLYRAPSFAVLALDSQGAPSGALGFIVHPGALAPGLEAQETFWYVREDLRSGMLGPRMLRIAEARLKELGVRKVRFSSLSEKTDRHLEKLGFTRAETSWAKNYGDSDGYGDSPGAGGSGIGV